jgi:GAF domain-containing protein
VTVPAVWAVDAWYLPLSDETDHGLIIAADHGQLSSYHPGDWVVATGTIVRRGGMPVLRPLSIERERSGAPRPPKQATLEELASFRYLGAYVVTEGRVRSTGTNAGGDLLTIADRDSEITIFLPRMRSQSRTGLLEFSAGDRVRVSGISTQYAPLPPYDRAFQVLVPEVDAVVLLERGAFFPPFLLVTSLVAAALVLAVWWLREHRVKAHRQTARLLNSLSEEIISAASPGEILTKLAHAVPEISGATHVRLYIYNRKSRALDRVASPVDPDPLSVSIESPMGPLPTGAALCYRNRTLLNIPDTRRSPFFKSTPKSELPRSVMFVPMMSQSEVMGVLEIDNQERIRYFTHEEQAAAQHLANQVATALKLQEQQSIREQLFRSERLAATGQLISGVANELRTPLETILALSKSLLEQGHDGFTERQLRLMAAEAQRAGEIVSRLVSFGRAEDSEARLIEINGLIASLKRFREREWKAAGITLTVHLSRDALYTLGAQGQLEQVFLNLLLHAEQAVMDSADKVISIDTSAVGSRILIEIAYSTSDMLGETWGARAGADASALGIGVSRGIIQSHGGEIRTSRPSARMRRFEVDLPLAVEAQAARQRPAVPRGRQLTALVVDPDATLQRELVTLLSQREYRVVPVSAAEQGIDIVRRLHFDIVFCSVRLPGLNWLEFADRVRDEVNAFVLMTDGFEVDMARAFRSGDGFVIRKPVDVVELDNVLGEVEARLDAGISAGDR